MNTTTNIVNAAGIAGPNAANPPYSQRNKLLKAAENALGNGMLYRCECSEDRRAADLMVKRGILCEPLTNRCAPVESWRAQSDEQRLRAIIATVCHDYPQWPLCSISAAFVMGLCDTYWYHHRVHLAVTHPTRGTYMPEYVYEHVVPPQTATFEFQGLRMVSPELALLQCARDLPFIQALPIWDAALRSNITTATDLERYLDSRARAKGIRAARSLLRYSNGASESGGESAARALMLMLNFQEPRLQVEFRNPNGRGKIRPDFLWRLDSGLMIAGEFDGTLKYKDEAILRGRTAESVIIAEKDRETALNVLGIRVVRLLWEDVLDQAQFEQKLAQIGVPRVAGDEYQERRALRDYHGRKFVGERLSLRGVG